jgi:beta-phosphoglucomutase family hydrolase
MKEISYHKFDAVIFDLDGVITKTALVHSAAWKDMFDGYLREREEKYGETFKEFTQQDYLNYVDGKPRYDGVKSFLESRGIEIPYGDPSDSIDKETVCGIGNRKNLAFNEIIKTKGVEVYPATVELIHRLKREGIRVGVASSSKNCETVLKAAGLLDLMETRVDGVVSAKLGLSGKPAPDIFTTAADNLGVPYDRAVVVEDAISGVQAGKAGNFGLVLGVAREDNARELKAAGADIVVGDIGDICFEGIEEWFEIGLEEDNNSLSYYDYNREKEMSREALLSVGNGYFGTRGAMTEAEANGINYPGTYMAGVYNRLKSQVGDREIENEDFVNTINWLPVTFKIDDGNWMDINKIKIVDIERKLSFKNGVLMRSMTVEDEKGRQTRVYSRRFASMANPNVAGIHYCVSPVNYSGTISIKSSLDATHINAGVKRYSELNQQHLTAVAETASENYQNLVVKTTQSGIHITATAKLDVLYNGENEKVKFDHKFDCRVVHSSFGKMIKQGEYLGLMKTVFIENSKERNLKSPGIVFKDIDGFEKELEKSENAWQRLWEKTDITIEGDRLAQKLIRLHIYHLLTGTSPHNERIDFGIPARGLTGEAYRGHIFWDELYILPFYFVHFPEIAKSVLLYRYRRLDEARKYAKEHGYRGAMFPWQSGSSGREETQKYHYNPVSGKWGDDRSSLQRHISLAVAYNIIRYYQFTGDKEFMEKYGFEMLLEINRFWASKSTKDLSSGKYHIDGVMGPDEFHEAYPGEEKGGLRDNAYTNIMVIRIFMETIRLLNNFGDKAKKAIHKTGFDKSELKKWEEIAQNLYIPVSKDGIIAQYEGYFDLKELDWEYYRRKYGDIHRLDRILKAEGKSPDEYKVAKQADMLMTFYNLDNETVDGILRSLGYDMPEDYILKNMNYYLERTSHGSTLSRVVHSYIAGKTGDKKLSREMFRQALVSDYNDIQGGTTAEGIHTGVMAGTIWIVITVFAGTGFNENGISLSPSLPDTWRKISYNIDYQGVNYSVEIYGNGCKVETSDNVEVVFEGKSYQLTRNEPALLKFSK